MNPGVDGIRGQLETITHELKENDEPTAHRFFVDFLLRHIRISADIVSAQ